jgi:hypothetical protein
MESPARYEKSSAIACRNGASLTVAVIQNNHPAVLLRLRTQAINALDRTGQAGKVEAEGRTVRDTGFAADSVHYVVVDEQGNAVAGEQVDGNSNPVPHYAGDGTLRVIVGSNTEPKDGKGYFKWIEEGIYGLSGAAPMSHALDEMERVIERELKP